ncbi:hypothetical protein EDD22DRAFT_345939 [Suillus occidentalis]|nr:hypothetical protein EDD22DRAFT_345939 [Suillus occidentalis]
MCKLDHSVQNKDISEYHIWVRSPSSPLTLLYILWDVLQLQARPERLLYLLSRESGPILPFRGSSPSWLPGQGGSTRPQGLSSLTNTVDLVIACWCRAPTIVAALVRPQGFQCAFSDPFSVFGLHQGVSLFEAKYIHDALNDQPSVFEWVGQRTEKHRRVLTACRDYHDGGRMQHPALYLISRLSLCFTRSPLRSVLKRVERLEN